MSRLFTGRYATHNGHTFPGHFAIDEQSLSVPINAFVEHDRPKVGDTLEIRDKGRYIVEAVRLVAGLVEFRLTGLEGE